MNVVSQKRAGGSPGLHVGSDYLVSIAESNSARFKMHTDDSLRLTVSKLNDWHGVLSQAAFEKKEQMYGFNYNAFSVIANERLRIDAVSSLMFDWAHCSVCDGVADGEFGELMKFLHVNKARTKYAEIGAYVSSWTFPKGVGGVTRLFEEKTAHN